MIEKDTPEWLKETQNRSWEPEILISGITLTFLFLLSNHIHNFWSMQIQEFGVIDAIGRSLYVISMVFLTGLKIILFVHLVLRGIWTGYVGLSYVFPHGVHREKLNEQQKKIDYPRPAELVIRIERICSLLFSFIFSTITFGIGMVFVWTPAILLSVIGLNPKIVVWSAIGFCVVMGIAAIIVGILSSKKKTASKLDALIGQLTFANLQVIYGTNLGMGRMYLIFVLYFAAAAGLCWGDITRFDFGDSEWKGSGGTSAIVHTDPALYLDTRDPELRIQRAAIPAYRMAGDELELTIAYYKEDEYSVEVLRRHPKKFSEFDIEAEAAELDLRHVHEITLDGNKIQAGNWLRTADSETGQTLFKVRIPIDGLDAGRHNLRIQKTTWNLKENIRPIENWVTIPFEIESANP